MSPVTQKPKVVFCGFDSQSPCVEAQEEARFRPNDREMNAAWILFLKNQIEARRLDACHPVVVIANLCDRYGSRFAKIFPSRVTLKQHEGEKVFAGHLLPRGSVQEFLNACSGVAAKRLRETRGVAIVIADHDAVEVFAS